MGLYLCMSKGFLVEGSLLEHFAVGFLYLRMSEGFLVEGLLFVLYLCM